MRYYKIPASDILVICDNFDLEFGKIRYRTSGVAGSNNGLKSVDKELGNTDYPRLRLGTENTELKNKIGAVDFVLSKFTPEEKEKLPEILNEVVDKIDEFISA
jgi:PTH1 family peptidyl-tRNA hydrolase